MHVVVSHVQPVTRHANKELFEKHLSVCNQSSHYKNMDKREVSLRLKQC